MPAYFQLDEPGFWETITPEPLHWTIEAARVMGYDLGTLVMSHDPLDDGAPVASLLRIPAGGVLPRHAHPCRRVEVVVRGSIALDDGRVLGPGDVMVSGPGEYYGPHTAGPEGSLSVEIFSRLDGMPPIFDAADGSGHSEQLQELDKLIKSRLESTQ